MAALLGLATLWGCGTDTVEPKPARPVVDDPDPPYALWSKVEEFRQDLAAERSASDGGGTAHIRWEEGVAPVIRAGRAAGFDLRYRVGSEGIAVGGQIHFMPEPFWGWSVPQTVRPERGGASHK